MTRTDDLKMMAAENRLLRWVLGFLLANLLAFGGIIWWASALSTRVAQMEAEVKANAADQKLLASVKATLDCMTGRAQCGNGR